MRRSGDWVRWLVRGSWAARAAANSPAVWEMASSYVAGRKVVDAVDVAEGLRGKGLAVGFAHLSDRISETDTPRILESLLTSLADGAVGAELSVKPSSIGLRDSLSEATANLRELCRAAAAAGSHVTLEMQRPGEYDATMQLYRAVREDHPSLGITLPANLLRVETECRRLAADAARVRLCVGSYPVGRSVGHASEHEKALALVRCLRILMESDAYPMLATHDPRIIEIAQDLAARMGREADSFEFQLLLGVRPLEQRRLADLGWLSRTYIPFGAGWYGYLATRIAARPRTLWSYTRAVMDKR